MSTSPARFSRETNPLAQFFLQDNAEEAFSPPPPAPPIEDTLNICQKLISQRPVKSDQEVSDLRQRVKVLNQRNKKLQRINTRLQSQLDAIKERYGNRENERKTPEPDIRPTNWTRGMR